MSPENEIEAENQTECLSPSDGASCCVPYSTLPLESHEMRKCLSWTHTLPDGREIMTGIAEDGTDHGVWVTMTKPMDNGSKSELEFRMTSEAAAALRELISEALNYPR